MKGPFRNEFYDFPVGITEEDAEAGDTPQNRAKERELDTLRRRSEQSSGAARLVPWMLLIVGGILLHQAGIDMPVGPSETPIGPIELPAWVWPEVVAVLSTPFVFAGNKDSDSKTNRFL